MKPFLSALTFFILSNVIYAQSGKLYYSYNNGKLNVGHTPELHYYDFDSGTTHLFMKGTVSRRGEYNIAISNDGKTLVFNTYRFSGWKLGVGEISNNKATNVKRFTKRGNYEYNPSFSSDDNKVVYEEYSWGENQTDLFVKDLNSGNILRITNSKVGESSPAFIDNDRSIIFTGDKDGNSDIFKLDLSNNKTINLTNNDALEFASSVSSRDSKIAFLSDRDGDLCLFTMNADGSNQKNLTPNLKTDNPKSNDNIWALKTTWSPDGQWIAFNTFVKGITELYIVKSDGSELKQITNNTGAEITPFWSRH